MIFLLSDPNFLSGWGNFSRKLSRAVSDIWRGTGFRQTADDRRQTTDGRQTWWPKQKGSLIIETWLRPTRLSGISSETAWHGGEVLHADACRKLSCWHTNKQTLLKTSTWNLASLCYATAWNWCRLVWVLITGTVLPSREWICTQHQWSRAIKSIRRTPGYVRSKIVQMPYKNSIKSDMQSTIKLQFVCRKSLTRPTSVINVEFCEKHRKDFELVLIEADALQNVASRSQWIGSLLDSVASPTN